MCVYICLVVFRIFFLATLDSDDIMDIKIKKNEEIQQQLLRKKPAIELNV